MTHFKNQLLALTCLVLNISLFAQVATEIKVNEQNPTHLSVISQKVSDARASAGVFKSFQALQTSNARENEFSASLNHQYQILEPISSVIEKLMNEKPDQFTLSIPSNNRELIQLDLIKVDLLAEGFNVFTSDDSKNPFNYQQGVYYRGVIQGKEKSSIAAISIFNDQIIGSFSDGNGNMVIQPLGDEPGKLILFNDRDIKEEFKFECLTHELETVQKPIQPRGIQNTGDCVRVYIECDYSLYLNKGGTSQTVTWITSVYNNVATLYANESISTAISEIFVWTSADPYSKTSSVTALNQFKTLRPTFNGDLAHLAALGGNNIGGVAWLNVLCSTYKYAYSNISASYNTVPTYSWTVEVMTHEMGHNLSSNHTQWCGWPGGAIDNCYTPEGSCSPGPPPPNGGTIMSYCHLTTYGINFNNGFGPLPGDKIRNGVAVANCLGTSCSSGCGVPTGLAISNITQTTATATWNSVTGATSYAFEYKTNAGSTWTVVTTTNPTYNMSGLTSGTLYNTRVKANCASGSSTYSATVNFTTASSGCGTPANLAISNITQTTASASWTAVSGALSYTFEYKTNAGSTWTVVTTTNPTYNMAGLTGATLYNTRVLANCSTGSSAYSAIVNFTTAGSGTCATPTNFAVTNITQTSATASWSAVSGAVSYNFQYKLTSSGTWSTANVTTTVVNLTQMSPATSYDVRVQTVCSGGATSAYTAIITFVTQSAGYCASKGNNASYEWVSRVKIGTIDRISSSDGGYYNGTALVTDVYKGSTYTLNHQAGSTGSSGTLYWRVWIDFNNNQSFLDAGEQVVSVSSASLGLLSANIAIPTGAATGQVRMRVSLRYGGFATSCQIFSYGEVEDYTLNIKAPGTLVGPGNGLNIIDAVNLYPNPFNNSFMVHFNSNQDQNVTITVMDVFGRILIDQPMSAKLGENTLQIKTDELAPANYLVLIKSSDSRHFKKMLKLE